MLFPYQSNTNCLCTTEDDVLADYQFPLLFSGLNYALVLVLKVQVELRRSVNFIFAHKRKREAEVNKTVVWLFHLKKQNKTNKSKNKKGTLGWNFAYIRTKFLINFEVAAANSSRHFCRQLQSDNGCLHQQTNLLTVFGPRGFNWQLVRLTSAVRRNIFQSTLNNGKEKLKFLFLFCSKLFPWKINKQGF